MHLYHKGQTNVLVGITNGKISSIPVSSAMKHEKKFDEKAFKILRNLSI
jgi:hypothetical protein